MASEKVNEKENEKELINPYQIQIAMRESAHHIKTSIAFTKYLHIEQLEDGYFYIGCIYNDNGVDKKGFFPWGFSNKATIQEFKYACFRWHIRLN